MEPFPEVMSAVELQKKTMDAITPLSCYLGALGYRCTKAAENEMLGSLNSVGYEFHHEASGRIITVRAMESIGIAAHLQKSLNGEYFRIADYLTMKTNKSFLALTKRINTEPWEHFAKRCVEIIIDLMKTDLNKVVKGEEWISVPYDWSIAGR